MMIWKEIINMKNIQHEGKRRMVMYTEELGREQEINTKEERKRRRKGGEGKRCS